MASYALEQPSGSFLFLPGGNHSGIAIFPATDCWLPARNTKSSNVAFVRSDAFFRVYSFPITLALLGTCEQTRSDNPMVQIEMDVAAIPQ